LTEDDDVTGAPMVKLARGPAYLKSGPGYQRHEKRLEQQKGRPNVKACPAEENLKERL